MATIKHAEAGFTGDVRVGARVARFVDGYAEVTLPHVRDGLHRLGHETVARDHIDEPTASEAATIDDGDFTKPKPRRKRKAPDVVDE